MASQGPLTITDHDQLDDGDGGETGSTESAGRERQECGSLGSGCQVQRASSKDGRKSQDKRKNLLYCIKMFIAAIFLIIVLGSTILNKLTLISLIGRLRSVTFFFNSSKNEITPKERQTAVTLYWYLQLILLIPNCITFFRCFAFGVLGKTTKTFPWPTTRAIITGCIGSVFEVFAMATFVYLVLPEVSSGIGIMLLCGVFISQILVDFYKTPVPQFGTYCQKCTCNCQRSRRQEYHRLQSDPQPNTDTPCILHERHSMYSKAGVIIENKIVKVLAFLLQLIGIVGFIVVWTIKSKEPNYKLHRPVIGYPLVIVVLSILWTNVFQEFIAEPKKNVEEEEKSQEMDNATTGEESRDQTDQSEPANINPDQEDDIITARFKSSFINSGIRLLFYPFVSYILFRYATVHHVDPWCLYHSCKITLNGDDLPTVIIQVVFTLTGYIIGWVACTMILSKWSLSLPLVVLSTPLTLSLYYLFTYVLKVDNKVFPYFSVTDQNFFGEIDKNALLLCFTILLWLGQTIAMLYFMCVKTNIILSRDSEMFLIPHYDGIFFEQQFILNRQTKKKHIYKDLKIKLGLEGVSEAAYRRTKRTIFICSTMYRENETEMKQMLTSIYNVACQYLTKGDKMVQYESHIFFDGAITEIQIKEFGLQLLSLLEETLHVKLQDGNRERAPYGYRLTWKIGPSAKMPFTVHFKDPALVKPKKRWSQVMYMNYVINYRIENDNLNAKNTFILTTDADIDFTPQSADVLLDMLASHAQVAAVCARTHPKGFGPIYWYQIFDYAIGHWFQKPAEHILGCVLCSPGCFSVFRCSALDEVLKEYSSEVVGASEFLMKDMGEDRWLCTLLIKKGWRLEYCAISEDQTYCPIEFGEFFKQRRRWIPSTIANLLQIMTEAMSITKENDSVSILFIIFQAIMVFSTAISPATVILVIASGLQTTFKLSESMSLVIITVLVIVSVFYGIICVTSSPKTQIDLARILSFIFGIVMSLVIVGIFKDTVYSIYTGKHPAVLQPASCSNTTNTSSPEYETCRKAAVYIEELTKSLWKPDIVIPVSTSTLYLAALVVTFFIAAVLHPKEFYCLFHGMWYLLGLPSGYLLLLIYSAANLDSQTWGTREAKKEEDRGLMGWFDKLKEWFRKCIKCCLWCCRRELPEEEERMKLLQMTTTEERAVQTEEVTTHSPSQSSIRHPPMDRDTKDWLKDLLGCEDDVKKFEDHGYTNKHFIAAMTLKDFEAIGIESRGFSLRLQNAAKQLPSLRIYTQVPASVAVWLERLELCQYTDLFKHNGYETDDDIKNLKGLKESDLKAMGIIKRAHIQRLIMGIDNLVNPTPLELRIRETGTQIDNLHVKDISPMEETFWNQEDIRKVLKPVSVHFQGQVKDLKQSLRSLRNTALGVLFLVNIMWIVLLYSLSFPELENYGIDKRGFQLLFLAVYSFVIIVQFVALICHRLVTLVHYLGRTKPEEVIKRYRNASSFNIQLAEV